MLKKLIQKTSMVSWLCIIVVVCIVISTGVAAIRSTDTESTIPYIYTTDIMYKTEGCEWHPGVPCHFDLEIVYMTLDG